MSMIYIHGLMGNSQGVKASLLRGLFPQILTPDFNGSIEERMASLVDIMGDDAGWSMVGSSLGGLMGAMFTCQRPQQVKKLILLAPALIWPDFASRLPEPVSTPTLIFHGTRDDVVPIDAVRPIAELIFLNLTFHAVDDDHGLYQTVHQLDWKAILGGEV